MKYESQLQITTAAAVPPLTVNQTALVTNFNADLLDGQHGSYYQNASNLNAGTIPAAQMPAHTGDVTSTAGSVSLSLPNVGTAGTYRSVTTDAKGRVTAGTNPTTLAGYGITDALDTSGTAQTKSGNLTVNSALTSGGAFYAATTVQYSNRQPIYTIYYGGGQDLAWKKVADITIGTGLYRGVTFKVDVVDNQGNFGFNSNCFTLTYFASCIRSAGVQDDLNNAVVTGPVADYVRVVKTATGVYELQIRQLADWQTYVFTVEATINSGGNTVTYASSAPSNGSTTGAIYTATAGWTSKLANIAVAGGGSFGGAGSFGGQITSTVATGTAPLVINSTTAVANLNADLLDGQHGSYFEGRDTTAVGFSAGTLTLTRATGNLTASLDGRYLPLTGGTLTGALTGTSLTLSSLATLVNSAGTSYNENIRLPRASSGYVSVALACDTSGSGSIAGQFNLVVYPAATSGGAFALRANGTDALTMTTAGAVNIPTLSGTTGSFSGQITSTVATGSAPFVVTSTTQVNNLNAQLLGGQLSTYYAAATSLASYMPLSGGTMTGGLGLHSTGTNGFYSGTGDAATYALYNFRLGGWNGMALENLAPGGTYPSQVVGVIDFRSGTIDMKGGFKVSGASVITENQSITISGDASGTGKTAITLTLANVATAGTYRSVTVNAKGLVTAGTNPTTLAGYGITDALPLTGGTLTGLLNAGQGILAPGADINYAAADGWTAGTGDGVGYYGTNFAANGNTAAENTRSYKDTPYASPGLVWATTNNDATSDADGGWNKDISGLVANKTYRSIVWVRRSSASTNGQFYHGCSSGSTLNLDNTANTNPYFGNFTINTFTQSKWYLSVGYVHANNDGSTTSYGGLYDGETGQKVLNYTDFKMAAGAQAQTHRVYLYYSTDPAALLDFWGPRFEEVDGNEPSVGALLGFLPSPRFTGTPTVNGSTIIHAGNYTSYPDATKLPLTGGTLSGLLTAGAGITMTGGRLYVSSAASGQTYGGTVHIRDGEATGANNSFAGIAFSSSPGADFVIGKYSNAGVGRLQIRNHQATVLATIEADGSASFAGGLTATNFTGPGTGLTGTATSLTAGAVPWTGVTGKPTTLAGYGITDALPITGGALTGTISIDTSGSTALVSSVIIKRSGQSSVNFGQYLGAWRSALQIQSNSSDRLLFLAPPEADYQFGILRSANGGLKIDVGGTTANQGNNAVTIDTAGTANFPIGLQQNGSAVLTAASTSAPNLSVGGSAGSVAWTGVTGKPTTLGGYGITDAMYQVDPNGFTQGDINGSGNMQRLWGTDSVQNLIAFRPPSTVEYTTDNVNWIVTTISNDVFDGKVFGKWSGFNMNAGSNIGAWTKVRMTWVNFGYHFFSHFTLCHSTNGHSMNFVFYKSDLNGVFSSEAYRVNGISSWPGYTFTSHVNVSGWWDTRDVRMVFELNGNNGPSGYPNNAISIGHIGIMGGYSSFNRVYDWDGSRNITLFGNLSLPGSVSATGAITQNGNQVLHAGNFSTVIGYTPAYGTAAFQSKSLDTASTPGLYQYDGAFGGTKPPDNAPNYRTIEIGSASRFSQIAMPWNSDGFYFRRHDGSAFSAWRTVIHDGNYTSYPDATKLPLTGGTLTGALNSSAKIETTGNVIAGNFSGPGTGLTGTASSLTAGAVAWTGVTGKPTTISGYGITDIVSSNVGSPVAADTTTKNGFYYVNSNISLFGQTDGALFVQAYDGTWASQIYQDYRTGQLAIRGRNSGTWQAWRTVLDSTNFLTSAPNSGVTAGTYNNVTVNAKGIVTGGSNVSYLTGNQTITLGGDLSGSGTTSITATIANSAVTNAKLNTMGAATIKGNNGGVANSPSDLSVAQVATMLSGQTMNINGSSASCTGNAATATNGFSVKPGWAGSQNLIEEITNFNLSKPSGFYQGYNATNSPTSTTWYNLINVRHSNAANDHGFQLAMRYYDETLWSRSYQGGTGANDGTFTTWRAHLHSGNYNSYAPTLTGGGASGSWGISITGSSTSCTGNAATCTTANGIADGTVSTSAKIAASVVTYAKIQNVSISTVLGNSSASVAQAPVEIGMSTLAGMLSGQTMNINGSSASCTGNAASATLATKASTLSQGGGTGSAMTFNWSGQSGQPSWLWGGNDGVNHYVYNPANFDVSSSRRLGLYDGTSYNSGSNSIASSGGRGVSLAPNTYVRQISFEFKNGTFTTIAGNYGGLLTIAPYDGTTASTGDSNYQLFFSSAAANSTSAPVLRVRAGIDTTWGSWATLIHDSNFSTAIPNSGVTAGTYNNVTVNAKGIVTGGSNVSYLTGNQTITLGGDLSGSGTTSITATIANNAVTNAKLNTMGAGTIKGNNGGVANTPSDLTAAQVATMLSGQSMNISGSSTSCSGNAATCTTANGIADGTVSTTAKLANSVVTYAKIQNVGASSVLGNTSASVSQAPQEITFTNLGPYINGVARAWVTFNENPSTGAITINASLGISSVTRINYGQYRVNFSTAFADANYAVSGTIGYESNGGYLYGGFLNIPRVATPKTTTYCEVTASYGDGNTYNARFVHVVFDR